MPAAPGLLARRSLPLEVAQSLGRRIVDGELAPGAGLPNEATLGAELGVSRTVVREAMKVLASKSLVEVRPRTGTRVRLRADWHVLDPDVLAWQFSGAAAESAIDELLEVRRIVEPAAAAMAAARARKADLVEIRQACAEMQEAGGDAAASVEPDLRFHLSILQATHNAFLRAFGALTQAALRASFRLTSGNEPAFRRSLGQHRAVAEAIVARDPRAAENAMRDLLDRTSSDLLAVRRSRTRRAKS